jgi:hypothetical protein
VPSQGRWYDFLAVDNDQCQDLSSPSPKPFAVDHGVPEDGSVVKVSSGPRCTVSTSEYCSENLTCFVKGEAVCIVGKLRVGQLDDKENQEIGALLSTVRNWKNPKKINATCLDKTRRHYLKHQYVTVWANGKYFTIEDIMRATHLDVSRCTHARHVHARTPHARTPCARAHAVYSRSVQARTLSHAPRRYSLSGL